MLKFKNLSICLLLLFAVGCSQDAVEPQQNIQPEKLSTIKVTDNQELSSLLDDLQAYSANHRTALTGLNFDSLSEAIQLNPDSKAGSVYSILIKNDNPRKFVNLVLSSTESVTYSYLLEFTSPNIIYSNSMRDFTGSMRVINLEGEIMDSYLVEKGSFKREMGSNNRSMVHCARVEYVDYVDSNGNGCDPEIDRMTGKVMINPLASPCYPVTRVEFHCPPTIVPSGGGGGGGGSSSGSTGSSSGVGGGGSGSSSSSSSSGSTGSGGGGETIEVENAIAIPTLEEEMLANLWELENIELSEEFENNPCAADVMKKLESGNALYSMLKNFVENTFDLNLKLEFDVNDYYCDPMTKCRGFISQSSNGFKITLHSDYLTEAAPVAVAKTIMHESIHAHLYYYYTAILNENDININDFPGIMYYVDTYKKDWQHQQMAQHYRDVIIAGMSDFDRANGTNNSLSYTALSWSGLKGTVAWNDLSPSRQTQYEDTYRAEDEKGGCGQ